MGSLSTVERATVEADTICSNAAISARDEGQEGQLAVGLLSTMGRAKAEANTLSYINF